MFGLPKPQVGNLLVTICFTRHVTLLQLETNSWVIEKDDNKIIQLPVLEDKGRGLFEKAWMKELAAKKMKQT